jgi:hypothetical protein
LVLVAALLTTVLGVGASTALAGGGNSGNAKACQKNGWQQLQMSTGGAFTGQDECVSYAAHGGTLFAPSLTATDEGCMPAPGGGAFKDEWALTATGFTPGSSLTITPVPGQWPLPFDGSGQITVHYFAASGGLNPSITFTDGNGVHASVTFGPTLDCST